MKSHFLDTGTVHFDKTISKKLQLREFTDLFLSLIGQVDIISIMDVLFKFSSVTKKLQRKDPTILQGRSLFYFIIVNFYSTE